MAPIDDWISALLDGIPEQTVLGIGLAGGEGVSVALLVAIFVSNLPESIGSATDMKSAGKKPRTIILGWTDRDHRLRAGDDRRVGHLPSRRCALHGRGRWVRRRGIAGDVVGSMIPEAKQKAAIGAGFAAVIGYAVAAGLSAIS